MTSPRRQLSVSHMYVIRGASLTGYVSLVRQLGGDPQALLRDVGISPHHAGDPGVLLPAAGVVSAIESAAVATNTADFGRRLADKHGAEIVAPLMVAARSATTATEGLAVLGKFAAAHSNGVSLDLLGGPHADLRFLAVRVVKDPSRPQHHSIEGSITVALRVLQAVLGSDFSPRTVHVPHPPLTSPHDYERFFGCRVLFDQPVPGLMFTSADLKRPTRPDAPVHDTAVRYLTMLTDKPAFSAEQTVTDVLKALLPLGTPRIATVARQFNVHPKALQRQLGAEGTTFADVLDRLRRETAERHLSDVDVSFAALARQLGYSNQSVFTRACLRWFGRTPSQYREHRDV
ncbi:AraC family transcriptional regulator [Mycolicibacterium sphagni]|uniref:AraC family transcriptional regulator n=1 Tax=Mycolicibacterium sphagni TaxID=1786 RepID=UPI0021F34293|nr:AraC family transcriptional regulator [Mycolicibacterium sphagni]MCV7176947.1 AraC family transcriptional regulator [Mycolicibacterium sphagni]